ncbi:flagellar basal body L-ring protein [Caballeronia telluris]|uniref:Flagellar L-ring protein n=1 Tax=Caballeronia telluris TaxID=326475 RepID=A0A158ET23_9BURK|nr:flagellar basal body L-ring protein [Caballeronia telluris]
MRRLILVCMACVTLATTSPAASAANLFDADAWQSLTADRRASKTGDIITILVYENSSASNSADTSTNTSFALNGKVSTLYAGNNMAQIGAGDNYGGKGKIERTGRLLAQISATVVDVLPNGDLIVAGNQNIDVNGEITKIHLKGRVRPVDIAQNNAVQSNRLADAQIEYAGEGFITDRSRPGLIPRFLAWLGLW